MKTRVAFVLLTVLGTAAYSAAQERAAPALQGSLVDSVGLPGQTWTSMGNLSPIEHNNGYLQSYFEQSATVFAVDAGSITLSPYVSLGLVLDTEGYTWNNKIQPRVGVKLNKFFRNGVVSLGSAYSYEDRFKGVTSSGLAIFVEDWFGWQPVSDKTNRFPGSSWAAVGNLSAVEHGNIIGQGYLSQGVVAKRFGRSALVPYAELSLYRDSQGFDWDNKLLYGSGIKAVFPRGNVYSEVGAGYLREDRFHSGESAGELRLFANFSFGWNLRGRGGR